jgi:SOUL heme-binding protein
VEIRGYGPRIAAETTVRDDENRARNVGFGRLAGYIFGGNRGDQEIAMTAPVAQRSTWGGRQIAMTAPVVQAGAGEDGWLIRFFMPADDGHAAHPNDEDVRLVTVAPETVAVLKFSGDRSPEAMAARTDELLNASHDNAIEPTGKPEAWFYDPPWTLPMRRRNEIVVPVDPKSATV